VCTDDIDSAYAEAQELGYEIVHPLTTEAWGLRRFFVRAPDGNVINITNHRDWTPNACEVSKFFGFCTYVLHIYGSGYSPYMLAKLSLIKPLVIGGAVAAAIAVTPVAAAEAFAAGTATGSAATHVVFKQDPGGGGCDANGNCGSGGQMNGPGGGPGGQGCVPGVGCGSGGQFAGPGGVPGGTGCLPGVGCGSGHAWSRLVDDRLVRPACTAN
jgi:hypothetical protein